MTKTLTILFLIISCLVADAANTSVKVTQATSGWFRKNDDTVVLAVEEFAKPLRLLVLGKDRKPIYSTLFSEDCPTQDEFTFVNPFLRFKILDVKGIASPVILAVGVYPGGSDIGYEVKLVAEKNGEIISINPVPILQSIQDGIYLGYINKKYGYGMITWKFQFDAAHYAPHKYEISIYCWDKKIDSFVLKKSFITGKRYETGEDALKHYGLPSQNFRNEVIKPEQELSTLGIEAEFLPIIENGKESGHNQTDAPDQKTVR